MDNIPMIGSPSMGFGDGYPTIPNGSMQNVEEATQQFVAILYSYMFKTMRESSTDEENGLFSGDHSNMMMGFLDQELGQQMATQNSGPGSLVDQVHQQLTGKPLYEVKSQKTTQEDFPEAETDGSPEALSILDEITKINNV